MARFAKINRHAAPFLGAIVGAVFIYAGAIKAHDPAQFATGIANFRILPWGACVFMSLYLPWLEILCGAALFLRRMQAGAAIILTALCITFLGALISAKWRGLDITCGCFGHANPHSLTASILIDVALLLSLAAILTAELKKE